MKKTIYWVDLGMSILTVIVLTCFLFGHSGCTLQDYQNEITNPDSTLNKAAEIAVVVAPAIQPIVATLPWGLWGVLICNIVSSTGAAIVAARKNLTP